MYVQYVFTSVSDSPMISYLVASSWKEDSTEDAAAGKWT
jgi:hypothetical protein